MSDYARVIEELETLGIMPTEMPSLGPISRALERSGLLGRIDPRKNIIIAGTNGKGSVAATLSALFTSAGKRAGLYTSPHLVSTCERFRICDRDISEDQFVATYRKVLDLITEERLTHFEALTLIAVHLFYSGELIEPVEWGIWEVGLGGRYDATNAIPHHACAITRLGMDHAEILGSTLEQIAEQKFGVIREGSPVIYSPMPRELDALREEVGEKTRCRWIPASPVETRGLHEIGTRWGQANLALTGSRAAENTAVALTLFEALGLDPARLLHSLEKVRWPGRFQRIRIPGARSPIFVSGDHNLQGVRSLIEILNQLSWKNLHLVVGIARDKEAMEMLEELTRLPRAKLYLTETPFKTLRIDQYPEEFRRQAVLCDPEVFGILDAVSRHMDDQDLTIVTGSLYLVGKVLERVMA